MYMYIQQPLLLCIQFENECCPFYTSQYSEPTYEKELKQVTNSKATGICCNPFTQRTILVICAKEWLVCGHNYCLLFMYQDVWGSCTFNFNFCNCSYYCSIISTLSTEEDTILYMQQSIKCLLLIFFYYNRTMKSSIHYLVHDHVFIFLAWKIIFSLCTSIKFCLNGISPVFFVLS